MQSLSSSLALAYLHVDSHSAQGLIKPLQAAHTLPTPILSHQVYEVLGADDRHLVLDCLATVGQPQQDEAGGARPWPGHSHV